MKNSEILKIYKKENKVVIRLSKYFYPEEIIEQVLENIRPIHDVQKDSEDNYFLVSLQPKEKVDLEEFGYEFLNYILYFMKIYPGIKI